MLQDWDKFETLPLEDQTNLIEGAIFKARNHAVEGGLKWIKAFVKDERFRAWCKKAEIVHYTSGHSPEWLEYLDEGWRRYGSDDVPDLKVGPCMCPNCVAAREALRRTAN